MPLWFALILPAFPLQLAHQALDPALGRALPLVITDGPPQRPTVACCNEVAHAAGVRPGQKLAAAQALSGELIALPRDPAREQAAIQHLAAWAYQFSAHIVPCPPAGAATAPAAAAAAVHAPPCGLLIETGGSAHLFGSVRRLHDRILRRLNDLGFHAASACAPTPRAAWLIAAARAQHLATADLTDPVQLPAILGPLPIHLLPALDRFAAADVGTLHSTLHALGLTTFADLLRLPRAAVHLRFGTALLDQLARALGAIPDPQPVFTPPVRFEARLELPADLTETTQLMFPAQRLLRLLEGFLRGRAAGATALRFAAGHDQRRALPLPPTVFELTLAAPERDATRLARLLQERLARVQLAAPAIDLALVVERPQPFVPIHASLLPPAPAGTAGSAAASDADWLQLAETLHARLGSERVFQLQCIEDHRPECAWAMRPLGRPEGASRSAQREGNLVSPLGRPEGASRSAQRDGDPMIPLAAAAPAPASALAGHAAPQLPPRPALLLRTPQALACAGPTPQYRGPLHLLAGPERIESGWWDLNAPQRHPVFRDYFVARNPPGQTLWVFRALQAPHDWFLHGFFA